MGMFINIDIDQTKLTTNQARNLTTICPVDIFVTDGNTVNTDSDQEDECILCELCLESSPADAVVINKLYNNERLVSYADNK